MNTKDEDINSRVRYWSFCNCLNDAERKTHNSIIRIRNKMGIYNVQCLSKITLLAPKRTLPWCTKITRYGNYSFKNKWVDWMLSMCLLVRVGEWDWSKEWAGTLNDRKTEVMRFSSKFAKELSPPCDIRIGDACIHPSAYIRNLGVTMDAAGSMSTHVSSLCRSASFALWKVGKIRHLLDQNSTKKTDSCFCYFPSELL